MISYTGTVMVQLLIELACDVLQCQRVSCFSPGDVVSEEFCEKCILSCVKLKERVFYIFINYTVHSTIYAGDLRWVS